MDQLVSLSSSVSDLVGELQELQCPPRKSLEQSYYKCQALLEFKLTIHDTFSAT
jgi:hypothetical protein